MTQAATQYQQVAQTAVQSRELSDWDRLMQQDLKVRTSYVPFQGSEEDKIELSPAMVIKYLCKPTRSGATCSQEQAMRFIMLCKARKLNPWEGDAFLVGYDTKDGPEFNLITAHQAFLKRAEAHLAYEGMESGVTVNNTTTEELADITGDYVPEDCQLVGGWAKVHRKDRKIACYRRLDLKSFQKGFGVWSGNSAGMIVKCAEADALRSSFPNTMGGMYAAGEIAPSDTVPNEDPRTAPSVNSTYKAAKAASQNTGADEHLSVCSTGINANTSATTNPPSVPAAGGGSKPTAPATGRPKSKVHVEHCQDCGVVMAGGKCPNEANHGKQEAAVRPVEVEAGNVPVRNDTAAPAAEDFPEPEYKPVAEDPKARRRRLCQEATSEVDAMSAEDRDALIGMTMESTDEKVKSQWADICKVLKLSTSAKVSDLLGDMKKRAASYIVLNRLLTPAK